MTITIKHYGPKVKKLRESAKLPTRGSSESAGWDLYADIDEPVAIPPHKTVKIGTGLAFEPPAGMFGAIVARSGMATNWGLAPANKIGICDTDYRGPYIVALHNHSDETAFVYPQDRIAQVIFIPYCTSELLEVEELDDTERGSGGFGSTGK